MALDGITVIIRARDEAANLGRCLDILAAQRGLEAVEVIVVDGGSRDGTAAVAARHGAIVIPAAGSEFSFGDALNRGADAARHPVIVALSAHAFPRSPGWLASQARWLEEETVACVCGDRYGPDGEPLRLPVRQDAVLARRRPEWGYANAAGAFRAELWRRRPFRSDLPGCEDKEWAWHWLHEGYTCVVDPSLVVDHDHTHDPLRQIFTRARREAQGYAAFVHPAPGPRAAGELVREWWSDLRWYDSAARARLSPRRAARLLGSYAGNRHGAASSSSTGVPRA